VNYLNGIREGNRYLMPAYGGFFGSLDDLAASVFSRETGAAIERIACAETQRRSGGPHCALSPLWGEAEQR
jgi:hypothetical protein